MIGLMPLPGNEQMGGVSMMMPFISTLILYHGLKEVFLVRTVKLVPHCCYNHVYWPSIVVSCKWSVLVQHGIVDLRHIGSPVRITNVFFCYGCV